MAKKEARRILVVEDEKPLARALLLKLSHSGFEVETAHDGEAALEMIQKKKFDLIILDLVMPKLDGFGVLQKLKEKDNKTPVVVSSNLSQDVDAKRARELGVTNYFVKSDSSIAHVVEYVKKILSTV